MGRGRSGFLSDSFVLSFLQLSTLGCAVISLLLSLAFPSRLLAFCVANTLQSLLFARFLLHPQPTFVHPVRTSGVLKSKELVFSLCAFAKVLCGFPQCY